MITTLWRKTQYLRFSRFGNYAAEIMANTRDLRYDTRPVRKPGGKESFCNFSHFLFRVLKDIILKQATTASFCVFVILR
jgi:hypothetical protein